MQLKQGDLMAEDFKFTDYHRDKVPPSLVGREFARNHVKVAGTSYRAADAERFLRAAEESEVTGREYGLNLRREPTNRHDPNAVIVEGYWKRPGFLGERVQRVVIGYLPADFAKGLSRRGSNQILAAQLKNGWIGDEGGVSVDIAVYVSMDQA
jgi:hypothetical protein